MSINDIRMIIACDTLCAPGRGGMERLAVELADYLANNCASVYLVGAESSGVLQYESVSNVEYVYINQNEINIKEFRERFDGKVDVYIAFCVDQRIAFHAKLSKLIGAKFIISESASPRRIAFKNWKALNGRSLYSAPAERISTLSQADAIRIEVEEGKKYFPIWLQNRVYAFPNGVRFSPVRKSKRHRRIVIVGGGKRQKKIDFFIKSFSDIVKKIGEVEVVVPGRLPDQDVRDSLNKIGYAKNFVFPGVVNDMSEIYLKSDVHVICSDDESFGLCTAESMCFGVPTVGCGLALGTRGLISHGVDGFLYFDNENYREMCDYITRLFLDADLYGRISENCYQSAQRFSMNLYWGSWMRLIDEVVNSNCNAISGPHPHYFRELVGFFDSI